MNTIKKKFQGRSTHRYKDNPMEKAFAAAWQKENDTSRPGKKYSLMEYLFAENGEECGSPRADLSKRDWEVANTVIQWLGSPVGQAFLRDVLKRRTDSARFFRQELAVEARDI
jgi:hypothetical protein